MAFALIPYITLYSLGEMDMWISICLTRTNLLVEPSRHLISSQTKQHTFHFVEVFIQDQDINTNNLICFELLVADNRCV